MTQVLQFDIRKMRLARLRASRISARHGPGHHGFLHTEAAQILGERLAATQRTFTHPAILFDGPFAELVENTILQNNPPVQNPFSAVPVPYDDDIEILNVEPASLDLIVSVFDLHRVNDLPAMMMQINFALKPDGLFLAVLPLSGTLKELQAVIMQAELEVSSGAAMRIDPFPEIRQLGDLLQKSGFKLPVCDTEERTIRYASASDLLKDIRGAGASRASSLSHPYIGKRIKGRTDQIYKERFSDPDGRIRATFNMAFLSGWKEDESQQKPLRPGSARHSLKDYL